MKKTRFEALTQRLVLVLGLGSGTMGCGGVDPQPPAPPVGEPAPGESSTPPPVAALAAETASPVTRAALVTEADDDLARLRGLEIVEVRELVLALPAASSACYIGQPCPDTAWDGIVTTEYRRQVPRLTRLTELLETIVRNEYPSSADPGASASDVAALNALAIVDLGGLLTVQPANNPSCYSLPCPSDISNAEAANRARAGAVHRWATKAGAQTP